MLLPNFLFSMVHYFDPHWPYQPPPPFDSMFEPNQEASITGAMEDFPRVRRELTLRGGNRRGRGGRGRARKPRLAARAPAERHHHRRQPQPGHERRRRAPPRSGGRPGHPAARAARGGGGLSLRAVAVVPGGQPFTRRAGRAPSSTARAARASGPCRWGCAAGRWRSRPSGAS